MTSGDLSDVSALEGSAASTQVYLKRLHYPASKQKLIESAKAHGAPDGVIEVLNQVDDRIYKDAVDLQHELNCVARIDSYESNVGLGERDVHKK